MKSLSKTEKEKLLSKLFWDLEVDVSQLSRLLDGEIESAGSIQAVDLYYRLLTTYDWHTLLKIVHRQKIGRMLDDSVLKKIKSKELKGKFLYAREFLLR